MTHALRPRVKVLLPVLLAIAGVAVALAVLTLLGGDEDQGEDLAALPVGRVLFEGDFRLGLADYGEVIHGERIAIVDDPAGLARKAARFEVQDSDVGPTDNPRAQIGSTLELAEGRDVWIGWSTMFPREFPESVPGWLTFASTYGPPAEGPGPIAFGVRGNEIRWQRNETYDYDVPWRMPLVRGRWIDFVVHERLAHDSRGSVELWVNAGEGWRRQLLSGRRRLEMRTLDSSNGEGTNHHRLSNYRQRGMFEQVTLLHASHRLGTGFHAVAPRSYGPPAS